jgi:hypothetical protein
VITDFPKENQGMRQALINSHSFRNRFVTTDEKEEQRCVVMFLRLKGWGSQKIHQELMNTLWDDAYGLYQIKIWLQKFRTGDLSCSVLLRAGRRPLTLGLQVEIFLHKYLFASAHIIDCQSNFSEKNVDEKILAALSPSFLERCSKTSCVLRQQKKRSGFCRSQK